MGRPRADPVGCRMTAGLWLSRSRSFLTFQVEGRGVPRWPGRPGHRGGHSADRADFRHPLVPRGLLVLRAVFDTGQGLLHGVVDLEVELALERSHLDGVCTVGEDLTAGR